MISELQKIKSIKKYVGAQPRKEPEWSKDLLKQKPDKNEVLFGLETEIGPFSIDLEDEIRERMGNFVAIHPDSGAIEVDSPPLTFEDAHEYLQLLFASPFKFASKKQANNWGMHIHVSSHTCQKDHLVRLLDLICDKKSAPLMRKIADRSIREGYGQIASTHLIKKLCLANYTKQKGTTITKYEYDFDKDVINQKKIHKDKEWMVLSPFIRYGVHINTEHGTHEFRLFKSTTSLEKALANLQTVKSLIEFTRKPNAGGIQEWLRFVVKNQKSYPQLSSWIQENQLISPL